MPILNIQLAPVGLTGVIPGIVYINTNDTLATVTTAGYLNQSVQSGYAFSPAQIALVSTQTSSTAQPEVGFLEVIYSGGNWSLNPSNGPGEVILPTTAGHFAVYTNATGTLSQDATTAINAGNIQAGVDGVAGWLESVSATPASGALRIVAVANSGSNLVTISNASHGQSTVYSIPDVGSSVGQLIIKRTALVNGNLISASGTTGIIQDAGIAASSLVLNSAVNTFSGAGQIILAKANGTEAANAVTASGNAGVITTSSLSAAGGATYVITWTNTKITATSVLSFCIQGGTNTTQNITFTCVPGAGTATLTIFNNTAATALNGTILIGYSVL